MLVRRVVEAREIRGRQRFLCAGGLLQRQVYSGMVVDALDERGSKW